MKSTDETVAVLVNLAKQQLAHRKEFTDWMRKTHANCIKKPGNKCLESIVIEEAAIEADRNLLTEITG